MLDHIAVNYVAVLCFIEVGSPAACHKIALCLCKTVQCGSVHEEQAQVAHLQQQQANMEQEVAELNSQKQ